MVTQESSGFVSLWSGFVSMSIRCCKPEVFWSYTWLPPPDVCCYPLQCDGQPSIVLFSAKYCVCSQTQKPLPMSVRERIVLRSVASSRLISLWLLKKNVERVRSSGGAGGPSARCAGSSPRPRWALRGLGGTVGPGKGPGPCSGQEEEPRGGTCCWGFGPCLPL